MQVTLDKTYPMPCTASVAWQFLQDIKAVAQCMPGASITERIDDENYKGTVSVRVGPATMSFKGHIAVMEINAETKNLHLSGKGTDTTGQSGDSMDPVANVQSAGENYVLIGINPTPMNGKN